MRGVLLSLVFASAVLFAMPSRLQASVAPGTASISAPAPVYALQIPDKTIEITVGDRGAGARWYRSPVWIAIGVLAAIVILLLLLVVMAARGGGTTIVKD